MPGAEVSVRYDVGHYRQVGIEKNIKASRVLDKNLLFAKIWGPLNYFEKKDTKYFLQNLILEIDRKAESAAGIKP